MIDNLSGANRFDRLRSRLNRGDTGQLAEAVVQLARAVLNLEDVGQLHPAILAQLPRYLDAVVGGLPVGQLYPHVTQHLSLCAECKAEYLDVLEVAWLESRGAIPAPPVTPQPDLAFL